MTSKSARVMTAKALTLLSVLLLAACDGGIFGTGDSAASAPEVSVDGTPMSESGAATDSATSDNGTEGAFGTDGSGTTAGETTGTTDSGNNGNTTGISGTGVTAGDVGNTGGTSGVTDESPDNPNPEPMTTDGGVSDNENGTFTNDTQTLDGPEAQLIVVNTSSQTLNVVSASSDPEATRFEISGIPPNTSSESTVLSNNATTLAIVDNNNPDEVLISYSDFDAGESTFTTLLVRDGETGLSSVALVTETQTTGPGLAKVRIVQGGTLGDAAMESDLRLLSAGENPGGVDLTFGPLSFNLPQSGYQELLAGDYELVDLAERITPFAVTLSGNTVYTLVLTGNGINDVKIIVDSEAPLLNP